MVFYFNANGELLKTIPEPIFQGSNKASKLLVVAPISANAVLNVSFKLPNGYVTTQMAMTNQGQLAEITAPSNALLNVWSIELPLSVTAYAGVVTVQFFVTLDGQLITTQSVNFNVNKGVPAMLPSAPEENVYANILAYLQTLTEAIYSNTQGTNGLSYSISGSTASVRGYSGKSANVVIPEWFILNGEYYPVTKIDNGAFSNSTGLIESVIIPESVTIIDGAFTNLAKLKEIEIPANVTSAQNAFMASRKLGKIILRGDVPAVSAETFSLTGSETADKVCRVFVPIEYYDNYVEKFKPYNSVWSQIKLVSYATTEDVKELEEKISAENTERKSEVSRVEGKINTVSTKVSELESAIPSINEKIEDIETKTPQLEQRIKTIEEDIPTIKSDVLNAETAIANEVSTREQQDISLQNEITQLLSNLHSFIANTYSKDEINNIISGLAGGGLTLERVDVLPATGNSKVIYLVPVNGTSNNSFDEYIWVNKWERIGSTSVDLTNYYTKEEINNLLNAKANIADLANVAKSGKYEDLTGKPTALKNPYALTFGSKTYDGSAAATVTKTDLGLGNVPNVDTQNAANISSGILPDARLSDNIARASALLKKLDIAPDTAPVGSVPTKTANGIEWKEVEGGGGGLTVIEKTFTATNNDNEFIATFTEEEFAQLGVNTLISVAGSSDMPIIVRYYGGNEFIKMYVAHTAELLTIMSPLISPTDNATFLRNELAVIGVDNTFTGSNDFIGGLTKNGVEVATLDDVANAGGGGGGSVTVDSELSETSENPVQNKVVTGALAEKITAPVVEATPVINGDYLSECFVNTNVSPSDVDTFLAGLDYSEEFAGILSIDNLGSIIPIVMALPIVESCYAIVNQLVGAILYVSPNTPDEVLQAAGLSSTGWLVENGYTISFAAYPGNTPPNFVVVPEEQVIFYALPGDRQLIRKGTGEYVLAAIPETVETITIQAQVAGGVHQITTLSTTTFAKLSKSNIICRIQTNERHPYYIDCYPTITDDYNGYVYYVGATRESEVVLCKISKTSIDDCYTIVYGGGGLYRHEVVASVGLSDDNGVTTVYMGFNIYSEKSTGLKKDDIFTQSIRSNMLVNGYVEMFGTNTGSSTFVYPIMSVEYDMQFGFTVWYIKDYRKVALSIFDQLNNMGITDTITEV